MRRRIAFMFPGLIPEVAVSVLGCFTAGPDAAISRHETLGLVPGHFTPGVNALYQFLIRMLSENAMTLRTLLR